MERGEFRFPLFIDLNGKRAVVIGGGKIACRRAEVLCRFGAEVTIIAPECPDVPKGVAYLCRAYQRGDLKGAFLAVAATDDRQVNRQVGQEASQLGIPVSVADRKEESSFFFPAICQGGGLVCGLVSHGTDHRKTAVVAEKIRGILGEME